MKSILLRVENLRVVVEGKTVVDRVNFQVEKGEVVAILGSNGSGKSSLAMTMMGHTAYGIQRTAETKIKFDGKDLLEMSSDERARAGLFTVWQNPVSIPGVSVFNLCRTSYEAMGHTISSLTEFKRMLETLAIKVGLTTDHISRNVNEGFSGGEKKRLELLQLLLLGPKLVILDEIDSGLDSKGISTVVKTVNTLKKIGTSFILITHNKRLLDDVAVDTVWEMSHGQLQTRV
jgi:Fe-S cluster assembly ATP-binding protein